MVASVVGRVAGGSSKRWSWPRQVTCGVGCRTGVLAALAIVACCVSAPPALGFARVPTSPPASCTIFWTGATSTDWSTMTNWSLTNGGGSAGRLPGASDFVCMSTAPTTASAVLAGGKSATIAGLDWPSAGSVAPSLEVDGTLTVGDSTVVDASTINKITVTGTLASFKGQTIAASSLTVAGGTLEGPGTVTVSGSAALGQASSNANSYLGVSGGSGTGVHVVLEGSTTVAGGTVEFYEGSELENRGTLTLSDNTLLTNQDSNAGNEFVNDSGATLTYTGSTSSQDASLNVRAPNAGTVTVGKGTLDYGEAGTTATDSGAFSAASGATVDLRGTHTVASGMSLGGAGTDEVAASATLSVPSGVALNPTAGKLLVVGTLGGAGTTSAPNLTVAGGTLEGPGTVTVSGSAALGQASVNLNSYLGVSGGSGTGVHVVLEGSTTVAGGTVEFYEGSELENRGTLTLSDNTLLTNQDSNAGNEFVNDSGATLTYTGSTSSQDASLNVRAPNAGTVTVGKGTLDYGEAGTTATDSGAFSAASGATVDLRGTHTVASGMSLGGAGTDEVAASATLSVPSGVALNPTAGKLLVVGTLGGAGTTSAPNLTVAGGTLEGPGTVTVSGSAALGQASVNLNSYLGVSGGSGTGVHVVLEGSTTVAGGTVEFYEGSELENRGTLTLSDNTVLTNQDSNAGNEFVNDSGATLTYTGSSPSMRATVGVKLTNSGTVAANKGSLSLTSLANLNGSGVLSGGTYDATGGSISLPDAASSNAASVTLGASPSAFTVSGSGNALTALASNSGSLDLQQSLTLTGSLTNTGTVVVENSSTLTASSYTQTAGTTTVVGGSTLESGSGSGSVTIDGGTLAGTGTVAGDVLGSGDVRPAGTVTGPMRVTGTYDNSAGTLTIPVSGTTNPGTDFGQLSVTGTATLGGALSLQTASGFTPPVGTHYTILKAGSVSGTFATVNGVLIGASEKYVISYTATTVVATVVPVPDVTGVSPSAGPSAGGTSVTISGSGFTGATAVKFGTAAASFTFNSDTQITATAPAEAAGTVDVTVTTPNGTSETSAADRYTFDAPPTLKSISPAAGPTKGGQKVTLTGTNFVSGATVEFGTSAASSVTLVSSTKLTALTPAHAAGTVTVTVKTPGGTTGSVNYTFDPRPTVTSVSPSTGTTAGGNTVTINGSGFLSSGTTVKFGSVVASSTFVSSMQMTATAPAESAGSVNVTVATPGGTSAASPKDLYAYGAPTVGSFAPISGITGSKVTVKGTGFVPGVTVTFGSLSSPTVTVTSGTALTTVVPNGASPGAISVSDGQGTGTSSTNYAVTLSITGFGPSSGAPGTMVTIDGVGFLSTSKVRFNGVAASSVTFVSSTELQATVPSSATSGPIAVTNTTTPTGTVTSPTNFTVT